MADCPDWGNALYWCESQKEKWKEIFRLTKAEARQAGARRIFHKGFWQERIRKLVQNTN